MVVSTAGLIGAAAVSALGSVAGAGLSNAMSVYKAKQLAEHQAWLNYTYNQKFNKWSALRNPTFTRRGLENAGYNPLLAVQSGQGIGPSNASTFDSTNPDSSPDLSGIGGNAVDTALNLRKQMNENATTEATVENTDADTSLKNAQTLTEQFKQANLNIDSQVKDAEKRLRDLDISNYERNQIRHDIDTLTNYKRMMNDYELGTISNQIQSRVAASNAQDVKNRYEIGSKANEIAEKNLPPKWAGTIGGILGTTVGAGLGVYGAMRGAKTVKPNFKTGVPYK